MRKVSTLLLVALLGCADPSVRDDASDDVRDDTPADSARDRDADEARDRAAPTQAQSAGSDAGAGGRAADAGRVVDGGVGGVGPDAAGPRPDVMAADPELEALRQLCVDEINRYRATVQAPPLARASDREDCSDRGAQSDGDTKRAHASASQGGRTGSDGFCPQHAQNTCPGWPVGGRSGNANVAAALKSCLKMMWDEGPPPSASCTGSCFLEHGHYLNMRAAGTKRVACGFYKMKDGSSYWMNQNFW